MARRNNLSWTPKVLDAANLWRDKCFYDDGSLFSNNEHETLWTLENIQQLHELTKDPDDREGEDYRPKLKEQLKNAPQHIIALDAEIHWFLYLFPLGKTIPSARANIKAETKYERINEILSWAGHTLPQNVRDDLLTDKLLGVGSSGQFYIQNLYLSHEYLLRLLIAFKRSSSNQKRQFAPNNDPQAAWAFAEWLDGLPGTPNKMLRNILLFFLYPDYFERILSTGSKISIRKINTDKINTDKINIDKISIVEHFKNLLSDTVIVADLSLLEIDKALFEIRQKLEPLYPDDIVDFHLEPIQVNGVWVTVDPQKISDENHNQAIGSENTGHNSAGAQSADDMLYDLIDQNDQITKTEEGKKKLVTHYIRERNPKLRKYKLLKAIKEHGHLKCECCGTDASHYPEAYRRHAFEVHHKIPLADIDTEIEMTLDDLALLCANCHRAIHATNPLQSVAEFKRIVGL